MNDRLVQAALAAQAWLRGHRDDRGASLVEYALLLALIAVVCFAAVQFLGESTSSGFNSAGISLSNAN